MAQPCRHRPRILLVEDELLIALGVESMLAELGYAVVGPVAGLGEAVERARGEPLDGALLDISLGRDDVFPAAEVLAARGIPFVFASGYAGGGLPERFRGRPHLQKPFSMRQLRARLEQAVCAPGGGPADGGVRGGRPSDGPPD